MNQNEASLSPSAPARLPTQAPFRRRCFAASVLALLEPTILTPDVDLVDLSLSVYDPCTLRSLP